MKTPVDKSTGPVFWVRLARCWSDRHFIIAAVILAITAIGWSVVIDQLKLVISKRAVRWPDGVTVSEDFRLTSLPNKMGPFVKVTRDGELNKNPTGAPELDGQADGEHILLQDVMDSLGVGTSFDEQRWDTRRSNWYVSRIYRDTRKDNRFRYWQLMVTYYTGGMDKVPHVGERCLVAGGFTVTDSQRVDFNVPAARSPWDVSIPFRRVRYEMSGKPGMSTSQHTEYYTFSMNGWPEQSWMLVRGKLADPRMKYCYFAKIQFRPIGQIDDIAVTDARAQDFLNYMLPAVLMALPMPADIEKIIADEKAAN